MAHSCDWRPSSFHDGICPFLNARATANKFRAILRASNVWPGARCIPDASGGQWPSWQISAQGVSTGLFHVHVAQETREESIRGFCGCPKNKSLSTFSFSSTSLKPRIFQTSESLRTNAQTSMLSPSAASAVERVRRAGIRPHLASLRQRNALIQHRTQQCYSCHSLHHRAIKASLFIWCSQYFFFCR